MSNKPKIDEKGGLNLEQHLAIGKLEQAFPEGFVLVHARAWHQRVANSMVEVMLMSGCSQVVASYIQKIAGQMHNAAAQQAAIRQIDLSKIKAKEQ